MGNFMLVYHCFFTSFYAMSEHNGVLKSVEARTKNAALNDAIKAFDHAYASNAIEITSGSMPTIRCERLFDAKRDPVAAHFFTGLLALKMQQTWTAQPGRLVLSENLSTDAGAHSDNQTYWFHFLFVDFSNFVIFL